MNTREGRVEFKNFRILLDVRFSSTNILGMIIKSLYPKEDYVIQWHTQAGSISANIKVRI